MIFDRTENDVNSAIVIRNKMANGEEISEEEFSILERGLVTENTISRILSKQQELKGLLNEMGYWDNSLDFRDFSEDGVFFESDLKDLFANAEVLKKSFFVFSSTPNSITPKYHYNEFNKLEKILVDIEEMTKMVKPLYRESGTFYSGG